MRTLLRNKALQVSVAVATIPAAGMLIAYGHQLFEAKIGAI
jgi:hypothetical protein